MQATQQKMRPRALVTARNQVVGGVEIADQHTPEAPAKQTLCHMMTATEAMLVVTHRRRTLTGQRSDIAVAAVLPPASLILVHYWLGVNLRQQLISLPQQLLVHTMAQRDDLTYAQA